MDNARPTRVSVEPTNHRLSYSMGGLLFGHLFARQIDLVVEIFNPVLLL